MKKIERFIVCFIIIVVAGWCAFSIVNMGFVSLKVEKFVDSYKVYDSFNKQIIKDTIRDTLESFMIRGDWLVTIDPNGRWLRFQYDPNCIELGER